MAERRSLMERLKSPPTPVEAQREKEFVFGSKDQPAEKSVPMNVDTKSPFSTRIRSDYAAALKRASLERQLNGQEPHLLCDILEQALEPWLKANGYLN